jgi:PITH domain
MSCISCSTSETSPNYPLPLLLLPLKTKRDADNLFFHSQLHSLLPLIDRSRSSALNEQSAHPLSSIIRGASGGSYLSSDADEQLILHLAFSQKVRLNAILLRTTPSELKHAPKEVRVYANKPNLGFDDVESEGVVATQVVELKEEQIKSGENGGGGSPFQLKCEWPLKCREEVYLALLTLFLPMTVVKFQNVDSVAIAIVSNQGDEDTTR